MAKKTVRSQSQRGGKKSKLGFGEVKTRSKYIQGTPKKLGNFKKKK